MADILAQLKEKEKTIRDLQQKKAKMDGQKEQLLKQLIDESGTKSVDEAAIKLEEMKKEVEENETALVELSNKMDIIINQAETKN